MKLTVFHAGDGDCLLLSSVDDPPRHVLVDGGRKGTYEKHTRPAISQIREAHHSLDVVCVSHIDDDHISGILRLVEDEVDWRRFEFLQSLSPPRGNPPAAKRPAAIGEVWHNGLFRLLGDDLGEVTEGLLETVATVLAGSSDETLRDRASEIDDLATGELSSMELSRRLSTEQLDIPLNPRSGGGVMKRGTSAQPATGERVSLGALEIFVVGPSDDDIEKLRTCWDQWIGKNRDQLEDLHRRMLEDEQNLGTLHPSIVASPLMEAALGEGLGDVTAANLASLILLVEEGARRVLLTGDGVSSEILEGLERHGKLDGSGRIHVDVLKVQHHGALANVTEDFVKRVTADHYVFCGNGAHDNPEVEVVEAFARARLTGIGGVGALGPSRPFHFWFTSSAATAGLTPTRQQYMSSLEQTVASLRQGHEARMDATFLQDGQFVIELT